MKIVIAMDSFKGSMTSMEAGNAAKDGVLAAVEDAEVIVCPLADGGEGTLEALAQTGMGKLVSVQVHDPLGREITANYMEVIQENGEKTVFMEMAQVAGLTLLEVSERDPKRTTTYGVGELICHALERGCQKIVLGIGGSATNDGGIGMLTALGYRFLDKDGREICAEGDVLHALGAVQNIDASRVGKKISECSFCVACDVENPLCGEMGATHMFAPQKGLKEEDCAIADCAMRSYSEAVVRFCGSDYRSAKGAGAAGGMGFALMSFLQADIVSGAELVLRVTELQRHLQDADFLLTGEGCVDGQTAMGKAPMKAAELAQKHGCKVWAFAGRLGEDVETCLQHGMDAVFAISDEKTLLQEAMKRENAMENMKQTVMKKFVREKSV